MKKSYNPHKTPVSSYKNKPSPPRVYVQCTTGLSTGLSTGLYVDYLLAYLLAYM